MVDVLFARTTEAASSSRGGVRKEKSEITGIV